jgi:hypothetical protein
MADSPAENSQPLSENFRKVQASWLIEGVLTFPFYSFYLGAPDVKGVAYLPNFAPRLGPRVIYDDLGVMMTFALPIPEREVERRGDSRQDSFIFNSYWRQNAYDVYYQRIRGFYVNSPLTELTANKPDRFPQLPDTRVLNAGFNWYYVFSPGRYSLRAAFDQNEFQLHSGGSWLINPFFTHFEISLGRRFVTGSDPDGLSQLPNVASGRFDTMGAAVGYGYTYIGGHFFVTTQAAWGPGLQFQHVRRADGDDSDMWSFAAKLNVNMAGGWNYEDYVGGMKILVDSLWAEIEDTQVSSSLVSVQLFFGQRF